MKRTCLGFAFIIIGLLLIVHPVFAHCDTLEGPVVSDAKRSLEKGDVTAVLKWVQKENEQEVKDAFDKALVERAKGDAAREAADMQFFETIVTIHRKGEGASFAGFKPAEEVNPAVSAADKSLANGSADSLVQLLSEEVNKGVRERFNRAFEASKHKEENVEAGRAFVQDYIEFMHFVEQVYLDAQGKNGSNEKGEETVHRH